MSSAAIARKIVNLIFFFGPTGMFFIPIAALGSFRLFYCFSLLLIVVSIFRFPQYIMIRLVLLFIVFLIFYTSASYGMLHIVTLHAAHTGIAANPLIRVFVIGVLMISFFFLAHSITKKGSGRDVIKNFQLSYFGFTSVFILGSLIYICVVFGVVPQTFYGHFVSLEQMGYGYLRLSPGTYPNEFGVLCSFYSIYALIRYGQTAKIVNLTLAIIFALGIFLTSTRTAYITFAVGYLTIVWFYPSVLVRIKYVCALALGAPIVIYALSLISISVTGLITSGYIAAIDDKGSLAARTTMWQTASEYLYDHFWLGYGFESPNVVFLHNLPLQLFAGLGGIGLVSVIIVTFTFSYIQKGDSSFFIYCESRQEKLNLRLIRLILAEHVSLFALTNHNQTHFLTWLLFATLCVKFRTLGQTRGALRSMIVPVEDGVRRTATYSRSV